MSRYLINYIILSVCILTKAQCRHEFENLVDTDETPEVYVADEDEDITPLLAQNYEHVGLEDNQFDNSDFQHAYLRKPIPMHFDDSYRLPQKYLSHRYVQPNYQIIKYIPSESLNNYASHRPFTPLRSNRQPTNHPLYANLFWRKIVYPDSFPTSYEKAGSNRHSHYEDIDSFKRRSLRNKLMQRKRYMNQLRNLNTVNKKRHTGFHPISASSVLNHKLSSPVKSSTSYYPYNPSTSSTAYRRKHKSPQISTAKQSRNQNQSKQVKSSAKTSSNTSLNNSPNKT